MIFVEQERSLLLVKGLALPVNRYERLFLDGYKCGYDEELLLDVITKNEEIERMTYNDFFNYMVGYAIGQTANDEDVDL